VADTPKPNEIGQAASGGKLVKNSDAPHTADRDAYLKAADRLFSQFRNSQGTDPRAFMTAVVAVMMHYPLDVAEQAADPYFGLPALQQWMPTPYDVKQFCDRMVRPRREAAAWEKRSQEQIRDRRDNDLSRPKQTVQEVEDEMAKRGIFLPGYIKRSGQIPGRNYETPETVRRKLGLTQEQWDALPDDTARGGARWKPMK